MNIREIISLQNTQDQLFRLIHEVDGLRGRFITNGQLPPHDDIKIIKEKLYDMIEQLHEVIETRIIEKSE